MIDYNNNIPYYFLAIFLNVVAAFILGILVDSFADFIQTKYNLSPLVAIVFHLIIATLVIYFIQFYISKEWANQWSTTTPGIFFAAIFFGLQVSVITNSIEFGKSIGLKFKERFKEIFSHSNN